MLPFDEIPSIRYIYFYVTISMLPICTTKMQLNFFFLVYFLPGNSQTTKKGRSRMKNVQKKLNDNSHFFPFSLPFGSRTFCCCYKYIKKKKKRTTYCRELFRAMIRKYLWYVAVTHVQCGCICAHMHECEFVTSNFKRFMFKYYLLFLTHDHMRIVFRHERTCSPIVLWVKFIRSYFSSIYSEVLRTKIEEIKAF